MAFRLVFARELTVDGLVFPAGALVPTGVLTLPKLASLRESNRIIEVREEDLGNVPRPHRVPQVSPQIVIAAREQLAIVTREYEAAKKQLEWAEHMLAQDFAPVEDYEPETRGVSVDLTEIAKQEPEPVQTITPIVSTDAPAKPARTGRKAGVPEPPTGEVALPEHLN